MVDVIKASSPVPKLLQFFAALQYQLHVFLKKADLCPHIPYDELKSIALESGKINYAILLKETNLLLRLCAWSYTNLVNGSIVTDYSLPCNPSAERCN